MTRILLADDSPHAQRMGERILLDEGYEVVTVTDGETALIRLSDANPDLVLADIFLPGKTGFEICEYVKSHPRHRHARVILLAGLLEAVDEQEFQRVKADGVLKKPLEASVVIETVRPLVKAALAERPDAVSETSPQEEIAGALPIPAALVSGAVAAASAALAPSPQMDPERVRAAVTVALDAAMPAMIEEITQRVLVALEQ